MRGSVTRAGRTCRWQCDACAPPGPAGRRSPVCQDTRTCVPAAVTTAAPAPPRAGRRAGDSRTLDRAGASLLPVPIPVSAEATQAPWPLWTPPCSRSAGGRAQEPPKPRSRLSSWGTAAAGRRRCCWPSPEGTSPRYRDPCPLLSGCQSPCGRGDGQRAVDTVAAAGPFEAGRGNSGTRGRGWPSLGLVGVCGTSASLGGGGHRVRSRVCPSARAHRRLRECREGGQPQRPRNPCPESPLGHP